MLRVTCRYESNQVAIKSDGGSRRGACLLGGTQQHSNGCRGSLTSIPCCETGSCMRMLFCASAFLGLLEQAALAWV